MVVYFGLTVSGCAGVFLWFYVMGISNYLGEIHRNEMNVISSCVLFGGIVVPIILICILRKRIRLGQRLSYIYFVFLLLFSINDIRSNIEDKLMLLDEDILRNAHFNNSVHTEEPLLTRIMQLEFSKTEVLLHILMTALPVTIMFFLHNCRIDGKNEKTPKDQLSFTGEKEHPSRRESQCR